MNFGRVIGFLQECIFGKQDSTINKFFKRLVEHQSAGTIQKSLYSPFSKSYKENLCTRCSSLFTDPLYTNTKKLSIIYAEH